MSGDEMTPLGTDGFMDRVEMFEAAGFVRVARPGKRWIVHRSGRH